MSASELTGDQILALLHGVGNRPSADIDASYADQTTVNSIVAKMATDYDLASGWLNSKASAFTPENAIWATLEELDGLTIQAADS